MNITKKEGRYIFDKVGGDKDEYQFIQDINLVYFEKQLLYKNISDFIEEWIKPINENNK